MAIHEPVMVAEVLSHLEPARGGLFAVDTVTGRLKWSARPTGLARGGPYVSTKPSISGTTVVVPVGHTLMAFSLATGKELWRGIEAAQLPKPTPEEWWDDEPTRWMKPEPSPRSTSVRRSA